MPVEERPYEVVEGSVDVRRRELSAAGIAAVLRAEIDERRRAAREYERSGAPTGDLRAEIARLERYRRPA